MKERSGQHIDATLAQMRKLLGEFTRLHRVLEAALAEIGSGDNMADARQILDCVAVHHGILPSVILSRRREQPVAMVRQVAMVLTRELTKHTLQEVAALYKRDHGTVIHAEKAITSRRETDRVFAATYAAVREKCVMSKERLSA